MKAPQEDNKPWYQQFWPWMLIALPASSVIAGIATVIIATQSPHSMVKDNYYKEGLAINKSIDRQLKAEQLGLEFELSHHDHSITLTAKQSFDYPVIYLQLIHPMTDKLDTTLVLNRSGSEPTFTAKAESLLPVNYRIRIYPPDNAWELLDRWKPELDADKPLKAQ
jgi:hypothetical protein